MNHTYRLIWSDVHQVFVAVAEIARARGKRASSAVIASSLIAVLPAPTFAADLPTGGQIVAGQGTITQSGTTMTITQSTDKLAANWQSFSIGRGHAVNFVQPSSSAVALNRVLGSDVSVIQGALTANGQVFLVNPNGVLFTPTAQVNVGSLIASTQQISTEDFMAGRYRFSGASDATIRNEGQITAASGGTVALIAARIENTGAIEAPQGNVLMGAGKTVTLDLGGPVKLQVDEGALNALIEQGGAIKADGGLVYLTAKAAGDLASAVINHTGITEAKRLATGENGEIFLMGDMAHGTVNVAGTLDASGGFIETSAAKVKVQDGAQVKAGHWLIDPNDFTIAASGGDITGATLSSSLASGDVTIQSSSGATSGNGDIFVRDNVTWSSGNTLTLSAYRNIEILANITASHSNGKVVLEYGQGAVASGNTATYSFGLTGSGFTGKINLQAGNNFSTKLGSDGTPVNYTVITSLGNAGDETTGPNNSLQGLAHSSKLSGNYVLGADINAMATIGWNPVGGFSTGFMPIGTNSVRFTGRFDGLGHTITNLRISRYMSGDWQGLFGATSSSAEIANIGLITPQVSGKTNVGTLVGENEGSIRSSFAVNPSTSAAVLANGSSIGGLVGNNSGTGTIQESYTALKVSSPVTNSFQTGGLVGLNSGTIKRSYATGPVSSASEQVGGLAGKSSGSITDSYASGNVDGDQFVGGLVGWQSGGTITRSYATGSVSGTSDLGGLVGSKSAGTITNSFYATSDAGGSPINNGGTQNGTWSGNGYGTGKTAAQLKQVATFTAAGWDIDDAGGTGKVWRIYDWQTTPLLRWALTPLTVTANNYTKTYDGASYSGGNGVTYSISGASPSGSVAYAGTSQNAKNAGSYTITPSGLYSDQQGYDIGYVSGALTILPKALTISGTTVANKTYDGNTTATVTAGTLSGLIGSETLGVSGSGTFANKNADTNKNVTVSYTLTNGTNGGLASNYSLAGETLTANITPASLTISGLSANSKVYDGNTNATLSGTAALVGIIGSDIVTLSGSATTGTFAHPNVSNGKTVTADLSHLSLGGTDAGNYQISGVTSALSADITPRPITVTADAKSKTAGQPDPALTYTTGCGSATAPCGLVTGESLSGGLARNPGETPGTYQITQNTITNANNPNYAITYVGADLTITPAPALTTPTTVSNSAIADAQAIAVTSLAANSVLPTAVGIPTLTAHPETTTSASAITTSSSAATAATGTGNTDTSGVIGGNTPQIRTSGGLVIVDLADEPAPATQGATGSTTTSGPTLTAQGGVDRFGFVRVRAVRGGINLGAATRNRTR
jgi:filamentous hemagglutinin family protein